MTALAADRGLSRERWQRRRFPLASGNIAYKGGIAAIDLSTGKIEPAHAEGDMFVIGLFAEYMDATSAEKQVDVDLGREILLTYFVNGSSIVAADIGKICYAADDQTVTLSPSASGAVVAGRIWAVETVRGVAVEKLEGVGGGVPSIIGTLPGQVSNDMILTAAGVTPGAIYDVPLTAAASTVTLPASSIEGATISFVADGTKNGHTVQYRDATGPANLTTALTASKRHLVICRYLGGKWFANAYVSP
jgi:hypothetical protein